MQSKTALPPATHQLVFIVLKKSYNLGPILDSHLTSKRENSRMEKNSHMSMNFNQILLSGYLHDSENKQKHNIC